MNIYNAYNKFTVRVRLFKVMEEVSTENVLQVETTNRRSRDDRKYKAGTSSSKFNVYSKNLHPNTL